MPKQILFQSFFGRRTEARWRRENAVARPVAVLGAVKSIPEVEPLARFRKRLEHVAEHVLVLGAFARKDERQPCRRGLGCEQ